MANAIFIDEDYLKDNSPFSGNVDTQDIYPYAKLAEDKYIQETIGTALYNRLKTALLDSPQSTNSYEDAILLIIREAMVWYTVYEATPFIWVKLRNIGLVKQAADNMQSVSIQELDKIRQPMLDNAVFYQNALIRYLCANGQYFDEFRNGCWSCGDMNPNINKRFSIDLAFDSGIGSHYPDGYKEFYQRYIKE